MFSLSRPILYSFLGRLPDPAPVIASMRVGFDVAMIFHNLLNQFRHLFVTFGKEDLPGVRRFMVRVTAVVVAGMVVVAFSPVVTLLLRDVIGLRDAVLVMSREVLMVMCALPIVVTLRNYFHGLAMVERKTGPMGAGAVMRNVATWGVSAFLLSVGWLNHMSAAAILIGGFLAETVTVIGCPVLARHARDMCAHRIGCPWPLRRR
jgi:peptidoglycan biosynthesis protein MviN/MurJ (putative lipid II flippase)